MYKKILVPLDTSKRAEAILPHVEQMAKCYGSEVVFLLVEESPLLLEWKETADMEKSKMDLDRRTKSAESYLSKKRKEFRGKGIESKICIDYGSVVKSILSTAEREGADIIAIASHGMSFLGRTSYGSVAAGVLQLADRPLLIVRSTGNE